MRGTISLVPHLAAIFLQGTSAQKTVLLPPDLSGDDLSSAAFSFLGLSVQRLPLRQVLLGGLHCSQNYGCHITISQLKQVIARPLTRLKAKKVPPLKFADII